MANVNLLQGGQRVVYDLPRGHRLHSWTRRKSLKQWLFDVWRAIRETREWQNKLVKAPSE